MKRNGLYTKDYKYLQCQPSTKEANLQSIYQRSKLHDDRNVGIYSKSTSNFILLLVTQLSYITRSCIKEALTILLRRPPTFHLKESVERSVTSSSQHCTHQVQYGRRWIRINPFNPTAHTPKMLSYFLRSSKFLNASKLLIP